MNCWSQPLAGGHFDPRNPSPSIHDPGDVSAIPPGSISARTIPGVEATPG
jgi:hypothetical protein